MTIEKSIWRKASAADKKATLQIISNYNIGFITANETRCQIWNELHKYYDFKGRKFKTKSDMFDSMIDIKTKCMQTV